MQRRRLRPAVRRRRADQNIVRRSFGVLNRDVEETVFRENAGVPQLEFSFVFGARAALRGQLLIGKRCLRVAVQDRHVAVCRRRVGVPIKFFHIFAVVALRAGHAEEAFFQKRVALVPERERETKPAFSIANAGEPVLVPAINPRARVLMRKIIPGVSIRAVIFAHRSPRTLRQIRPPKLPRLPARSVFRQSRLFGIHHCGLAAKIRNRQSKIVSFSFDRRSVAGAGLGIR